MGNILKTFFAVLMISLFSMPVASFADWHGHNRERHGGGFSHHDRSFVGVNFSVWPNNYYYGAPNYPYYPDDAVLVSPPVTVIQQPVEVIQPPAVIDNQAQSAAPVDVPDSMTINIPNDKGSYTAVTLKKSGNGFTGPQGEFYPEFPKVAQLKVIYGK
jgi:hypothetical protein